MFDIRVKELFFDTKRVKCAVDRARRAALSKAGAFVRRRAMSSIRKRKKSSEPGKPPSSHTGLLKKFIFFSYDERSDSVVIGPVPMAKSDGKTLKTLEFGGRIKSTRPHYIPVKAGRAAKGRVKRRKWVKLPAGTTMNYAARPYMGPALKAEEPKLPSYWRESVKGGL